MSLRLLEGESGASGLPAASFDTVGIAVPCDDFDRDVFDVQVSRNRGVGEPNYRYKLTLPGGGFIGCGVGNAAWLEASLPKRVFDGENVKALPIDDTLEVLRDVVEEARWWVDIPRGHLFEESKLVRVDLVRDFHGVNDQTEVLDGLAAIDQPGRAKVRRFADPSANRAETLRVGPKAWGCTLYDKHAETNGKAEPGSVRFEARLHQDQLMSVFQRDNGGCFSRVGDLTRWDSDRRAGALAHAARAWFGRVGFDRAVSAKRGLYESIAAAGLSHTEAAGVWAYLTLPGWAATVSKNSRTKYRRIAANLGYAPIFDGATVPVDQTEGRVVRLDFQSATLVAA